MSSVEMSVRVVQVDTRAMLGAWGPCMREWTPGPTNSTQAMREAFAATNPRPEPKPYHAVTALANAWQCRQLGWRYDYVHSVQPPPDRHASWVKLDFILRGWAALADDDVVMVLDTDAWIRDGEGLRDLVRRTFAAGAGDDDTAAAPGGDTAAAPTVLVLSGEPPTAETAAHEADSLNGGFLCFRVDDRVRRFFQTVWDMVVDDDQLRRYKTQWPWEQACLCRAHAANACGVRAWSAVLPAAVCNTPGGTLVSHCWWKEMTYAFALDDLLTGLATHLFGRKATTTTELVVAKYEEDVSWVYGMLPRFSRVTIYDKSRSPVTSRHPKVRVVPLPNVGREAHTYAHHFAERWDGLCDVVVCTQGRYDDHLSHKDFCAMVGGQEQALHPGLDVRWRDNPMNHFGWTVDVNWSNSPPMVPANMSMAEFFKKFISDDDDVPPSGDIHWWMGAIFAVTAADVRRHPKAKYAAIRAAMEGSINAEVIHMMERFWRPLLLDRTLWARRRVSWR